MVHRRIVHGVDVQRGVGLVLAAVGNVRRAIAHRPGDGAGGVGAIVGRVVAGRVVADGIEYSLIMGERVDTGQRQLFGGAVIADRDAGAGDGTGNLEGAVVVDGQMIVAGAALVRRECTAGDLHGRAGDDIVVGVSGHRRRVRQIDRG